MAEEATGAAKECVAKTNFGAIAVAPTDTVLDVMKVMAERKIGMVLVVDGERLVGLVSEQDCVRKLDVKGRSARDTRAAEIMSTDVLPWLILRTRYEEQING